MGIKTGLQLYRWESKLNCDYIGGNYNNISKNYIWHDNVNVNYNCIYYMVTLMEIFGGKYNKNVRLHCWKLQLNYDNIGENNNNISGNYVWIVIMFVGIIVILLYY